MSKNRKRSQADSRPPVDALQYEKLALSAFHLCDRQMSKLKTLIALASTIGRNPAVTTEERCRQQTMLDLLVSTAEQYRQELACDRELFQVIALDSKGVPAKRITASRAARLLHEATDMSSAAQMSGMPAGRHAPGPADAPSSDDMLQGGSGPDTTQH
ncbi:MAG: FIG00459084: hypothetical protein [uncultured Paraburkholderia sp.]|nr:MAG: FIG00459084: hypothetical protein [uncultured Paraburkholderia sp.]